MIFVDDPDVWASPASNPDVAAVYVALQAGDHFEADPIGARIAAAAAAWEKSYFDVNDAEVSGLLLRDQVRGKRMGNLIFGFVERDGTEWVASRDGTVRYFPLATVGEPRFEYPWRLVEVTGAYEPGLIKMGFGLQPGSYFHRGPDRVSSPATVQVAAELGKRWTPAYMDSQLVYSTDSGGLEADNVITLFAASGDVLATSRQRQQESYEDQLAVGLQVAEAAGWLDSLAASADDATKGIHKGGESRSGTHKVRIPVAVADASAWAEWVGDHNPTATPVQEWLSAGGLKALAGTAAFGRQLMGPVAA